MQSMQTMCAIILTKNEELDLPGCLQSLHGVATEVCLIDSGSTDRTIEIGRAYGAHIYVNKFVNYSSQLNWALDHIQPTSDWVLRIDADERLSDLLRRTLKRELCNIAPEVTGLLVSRRTFFLNQRIRWGDTYPVWLLRLWRPGKAKCEELWMDEHMVLNSGRTEKIAQGDLDHFIPKSLSAWTTKHDWYADRECKDVADRHSLSATPTRLYGQAAVKRIIKTKFYLRLPLFVRPCLYFVYRYVLRLGILDGRAGLIYHFLHAFWYRFLVDAKIYEQRNRTQLSVNVEDPEKGRS